MSRHWPILIAALLSPVILLAAAPARAQQLDPSKPRVTSEGLFHLALEARRKGDEHFAAAILERVVRLDPGAVLPRLELAEALLSLSEPAMVEALLSPVASRIEAEARERPDSAARFYRLRGSAAARAGRKEEALGLYERAIDLAPENLGMRGLVVSMYRSRGDERATARHLVAAAALRPDDADLRGEAGNALLAVERFAEAEHEFRIALHIDLWAVAAWEGLGQALAGQRRWAEAEEVYRGVLRLAPESAALHKLLGDALVGAGREEEARIWFDRAAALRKGDTGLRRKIDRMPAQLDP